MSKKQKTKLKFMPFPILSWVMIVTIVVAIGLLILFIVSAKQNQYESFLWIGVIVFLGIFPFAMFVLALRRYFCIVTIDENGISSSTLGMFYKLSMTWDEIAEVSCFDRILPMVVFSKTKSTQGMQYEKIIKIKDTILFALYPKRYNLIKKYIQQPIVGLTDDMIKKWKYEK